MTSAPGNSVQTLHFGDDGATPNSALPVLLYPSRLSAIDDKAAEFEALCADHRWRALWRGGIFDYHHFHPNAHEALGVASGHARVTLGGQSGQTLTIRAGDVLVLPAGTGHRCVEHSADFVVVGAYPHGQEDYEIQRPASGSHARTLMRIAQVPLPEQDPLAGAAGPLMTAWGRRRVAH